MSVLCCWRECDCCSCISLHIPNVVGRCLGRVGRRSSTNTFTIPPLQLFLFHPHMESLDKLLTLIGVLQSQVRSIFANDAAQGIYSQGCPGEQFNWFNFLEKKIVLKVLRARQKMFWGGCYDETIKQTQALLWLGCSIDLHKKSDYYFVKIICHFIWYLKALAFPNML